LRGALEVTSIPLKHFVRRDAELFAD